MKTIAILFAAISLSTMTAAAQNKVGEFSLKPMIGINVSDLSSDEEVNYKAKVGFTEGMEAEYGVTPWLGVSLGAMYSQQGAKYEASLGQLGVNEEGRKVAVIIGLKGKLKADYILCLEGVIGEDRSSGRLPGERQDECKWCSSRIYRNSCRSAYSRGFVNLFCNQHLPFHL